MTETTDKLGTYSIPTDIKPIDETEAESIYLHVFDNGNVKDSSRYKVSLNFKFKDKRKVFIAPILNEYKPSYWLRSVDEEVRQENFFQQAVDFKSEVTETFGRNLEKSFSVGFFYDQDLGHKSPFDGAYAYMFKEQHEAPLVGFRFFDYAVDLIQLQENEFKGESKAPTWRYTIRQAKQSGMISAWKNNLKNTDKYANISIIN